MNLNLLVAEELTSKKSGGTPHNLGGVRVKGKSGLGLAK
jgi:hypothetical protein